MNTIWSELGVGILVGIFSVTDIYDIIILYYTLFYYCIIGQLMCFAT